MHLEAAESNSRLGAEYKVADEASCDEMIRQLDQKGIDFSICCAYSQN